MNAKLSLLAATALIALLAPAAIAGAPAARQGDMHTCPMMTALVPHVGGPVLAGSPNVSICGMPAARLNDQLTCVGPADRVAKGSATVLINGLPAAHLGSTTAHGGQITAGCPTVLIGQ